MEVFFVYETRKGNHKLHKVFYFEVGAEEYVEKMNSWFRKLFYDKRKFYILERDIEGGGGMV